MIVMSAQALLKGFAGTVALIGLMYWLTSGHTVATTAVRPNINTATLRSGDIIFRRGPSLESQAVVTFDGGAVFSHVGIVVCQDGVTQVIHVVPAEGGPDITKTEPVEEYLRSDRALAAKAYRVISENPSQIKQAVEIAKDYARHQVPFDNNFDLASDDALYCTELVWRAYQKAGIDLLDGHFEQSTTSLIKGPVIWPSSLLHSEHLEPVWEWKEK